MLDKYNPFLIKNEALQNNGETIGEISEQLQNDFETTANPFPVGVFPEAIKEIIKATNECLKFPIDYIGASILYAVSVSIGNTFIAEIMKGYTQNAVLYMAIVGRPGTTKTYPLKWALKPIKVRDDLNFNEYQIKYGAYQSNLEMTKKERLKQGHDEHQKPVWKQHLVSDFTPEALASVHLSNKRGLGVDADELASWFKNFNRYNKGSEEEFWLSVWSGSTIKINRKTSEPINIPNPYISVGGTIQPGVLNQLAENRTENGFIDRILFVIPDDVKKEYWSEIELSNEIEENWNNIISTLLDIQPIIDDDNNPQPVILRFTPEAKKLLFEFQRDLTDRSNNAKSEAECGIHAKMEMYAIRLALCFEMMRFACGESQAKCIGIEAVEGAIELVKHFTETALQIQAVVVNVSSLEKLPADKRTLYKSLPNKFTTGEGVQVAKDLGIPERTFKYFLKNKDLFNNPKRGQYEKQS